MLNCDGGLSWVECLPNSSLGMQSPFEVYYGRQPNRFGNKLSLSKAQIFDVLEEGENNFKLRSPKKKH